MAEGAVMDPRFPKFDPAGHVFSGGGEIWRDGERLCAGYGPVPIGPDLVVVGRDTGGDVWEGIVYDAAARSALPPMTPWHWNFLNGSDAGVWWGADSTGHAECFLRDQRLATLDGVSAPKLSRSGRHQVWMRDPSAVTKTLVLDGEPLVTDAIFDCCVSDLAVCWDVARGRERHVLGRLHTDPPGVVHVWNVEPWEGGFLIDTYTGPWLLSTTQTGLIVRPVGEVFGHRFTGDYFEVDARWLDGRIHIVARRGDDLVREAVSLDAPRVDLRVQPVPNPEPEPDPEPDPEPINMGMLDTLNRLRAAYGATMTDDQCVELINAAAWTHRTEGYGLSRKEAGTRGTRYDGQDCCHDVLMLRDGTYWDCLASAGGASTPTWGAASGRITDPVRGWIAPIVPQADPQPQPDPDPQPDPVTTTLTAAHVQAIVEAALRQHEQIMAGPIAEIAGGLAKLRDDLEAWMAQPQQTCMVPPQPWALEGALKFKGYAARLFGTEHEITGAIGPKK